MTKARFKAKMIPLLAVFGVVCLFMICYRGYTYAKRNQQTNNGNKRWQSVWYQIWHEFQYFFNVGAWDK